VQTRSGCGLASRTRSIWSGHGIASWGTLRQADKTGERRRGPITLEGHGRLLACGTRKRLTHQGLRSRGGICVLWRRCCREGGQRAGSRLVGGLRVPVHYSRSQRPVEEVSRCPAGAAAAETGWPGEGPLARA
jgi:hypothetical protein